MVDWPEPFGLVMIEALACGTAVIGFPCGSVPEIIVEGETGFMVEDIDRAVEAVGKIEQISRARCRREFEQRFTDQPMAEDYIRIYSNCSPGHLLKPQRRVASCDRTEARSH